MVKVDRLLSGNETLYGENPVSIAELVQEKLQELTNRGRKILSVMALPDYHNFSDDGGIKDVFFLHEEDDGSEGQLWFTHLIISENKTMHGWKTEEIMLALTQKLKLLESEGFSVKFIVAITDHHSFTTGAGIGGEDGTKNIIICATKKG